MSSTERYSAAELRADPQKRDALFSRIRGAGPAKRNKSNSGPAVRPPDKAAEHAEAATPVLRKGWRPTVAPTHDCLVGIDPGVATGVAIKDRRSGAPLQLLTLDFWRVTELLLALFAQHDDQLLVIIEDPGANKRVLYRSKNNETGDGKREKMAANVGANRREATLLIEFCRLKGISCEAEPPKKGNAKLDADQFFALTGITEGSQHSRDAARLLQNR